MRAARAVLSVRICYSFVLKRTARTSLGITQEQDYSCGLMV
jgi:hypothetical protein